MLCNMAIEGGNFTTAFFKEDSVRDLFNVDGHEKQHEAEKEEEKMSKKEEDKNKSQTENDLTNEQYEKVFLKMCHFEFYHLYPKLY